MCFTDHGLLKGVRLIKDKRVSAFEFRNYVGSHNLAEINS